MIKGVHTMFYSSQAKKLRAFVMDNPGFAANDFGDGWLIFDVPVADMGVHPADRKNGGRSGDQDISFYCDNIHRTVNDLKAKGVKFKGEIGDHGCGLVTCFELPGGFNLQLYEPKYGK